MSNPGQEPRPGDTGIENAASSSRAGKRPMAAVYSSPYHRSDDEVEKIADNVEKFKIGKKIMISPQSSPKSSASTALLPYKAGSSATSGQLIPTGPAKEGVQPESDAVRSGARGRVTNTTKLLENSPSQTTSFVRKYAQRGTPLRPLPGVSKSSVASRMDPETPRFTPQGSDVYQRSSSSLGVAENVIRTPESSGPRRHQALQARFDGIEQRMKESMDRARREGLADLAMLRAQFEVGSNESTPERQGSSGRRALTSSSPWNPTAPITHTASPPLASRQEPWPKLFAIFHHSVELWTTSYATLPIRMTEVRDDTVSFVVTLAENTVGDQRTARQHLESSQRSFIITGIVNQYIVATVWEKTSRLYDDVDTPAAIRYEELLHQYVEWWRPNAGDHHGRELRLHALALLGKQVPSSHSAFYNVWLTQKAERLTNRLWHMVSCLVPRGETYQQARQSLRSIIEQAIRMALRMRTEDADWEFKHPRHGDNFTNAFVVIRNAGLTDPFNIDDSKNMVDVCISGSAARKYFELDNPDAPMKQERVHKAEIIMTPKTQRRSKRDAV